ncbi:MAG: patatin-like phospholipase family protein [Nonlabens sp.]
MSQVRRGLVLSGGGHRGVAHAGALKAMQEQGFEADKISGVSAGAIVGAMYAANYSPEDILDLFKKIKLFSFSTFARRGAGLVSTQAFHNILLDYFPDDSFESLSKELHITAANLITARKKVFKSGRLIPAILASSAVPGVFTPIEIDGQLYTDGGILDNFPVKPLRKKVDEIHGIYVCPLKEMKITDFKRSYDVVNRAMHLKMHSLSLNKFKECETVVYPQELCNYHLFQSGQVDTIYRLGYEAAQTVFQIK